ncbi:MAG: thioredoxin-like domain-containing protein [Saprospiraceae bacterium]|nr:thioredoxin-like domain-containing protein [Saprospiraceae bacterium]
MNLPTFLLLLLPVFTLSAQNRATLTFEIAGLKSRQATLAYYYGGQAYRLDSVPVTPAGRFVFQRENLDPGVYFVVADGSRLFDFLVTSASDSFTVKGSYMRTDSLWVDNSPENAAYFNFETARKKLEERIKAKEQLLDMIGRAAGGDQEALRPIADELEQQYKSGDSLALAFIQNHPQSLYARMLRSVRPPDPPKNLPATRNGKPNPAYARWQRAHYFDQTDFTDERLLRNNFWHSCFDGFFSRHVTPQPDSLIAGIDEVLRKMPRNGAFYRFAVARMVQFFEQNEAPGADRVFVHLVDKYLRKDDTPWLDRALLERLAYKADIHRPNLTGSLALNFTLPDENGIPHALYEVEAPLTMLVFYSPLCDHCKELMPKIYQIYLDYLPKGIKAVVLNTDLQYVYWKKFVIQQGWQWLDLASPDGIETLEKQYAASNLPVIYLLDKDKRILAKRVRPDQLGEMLAAMFGKK